MSVRDDFLEWERELHEDSAGDAGRKPAAVVGILLSAGCAGVIAIGEIALGVVAFVICALIVVLWRMGM